MHLSDHDLRQMDGDWLEKLPEDKLRQVSGRMLQDLKERLYSVLGSLQKKTKRILSFFQLPDTRYAIQVEQCES